MYLSMLLLATFTSSFIPDCLAATFTGQCKDRGKVSVCVMNGFFCSTWPRLKLNTKIGLHTTTHHPPPHKLLGSNISAVTDPILIKL